MNPPRAFISYSHDTAPHKEWVLDFDIMKNIIKSIHKNNIHIDENIEKILSILDYAITNKKSIYS